MLFRNRTDAGRRLARRLERYAGRADVVVLALPRGGVPVGFEIARALKVPLDVFLVRKLGVPGQEELAMGALASGGVRVINESLVRRLGVPTAMIEEVAAREERELARRERAYRGTNPPLPVAGRTVILVDDGLATGASLQAGLETAGSGANRRRRPGRRRGDLRGVARHGGRDRLRGDPRALLGRGQLVRRLLADDR